MDKTDFLYQRRFLNEFLVLVDETKSPGFYSLCNSVERFNEYIESSSGIKVNSDTVLFNDHVFGYKVTYGKVKGREQKFFHITLSCFHENLATYKKALRSIKSTLYQDGALFETLRDDVSFYYSYQAYAKIHNIENLMRKFITYFMVTNVGKDWIQVASPEQIKTALSKSKRREYIAILQQLDFSHLGEFLFKAYQDESTESLFGKINSYADEEKIDAYNLKAYLPISNWDKYFKDTVGFEDSYLKEKWERLYELRNIVAHTSHLTEAEYEEIDSLCNDVEVKLESAFVNIDTIDVSDLDKETLSVNIAGSVSDELKIFLTKWESFKAQLCYLSGIEKSQDVDQALTVLEELRYLSKDSVRKILSVRSFRNMAINNIENYEPGEIKEYLGQLRNLNGELNVPWKHQVIAAFKKLGGEASLADIYEEIESNSSRSLPISWQSSVRRVIYTHSSDADIFLGKEDLFEKIGKGVWRLRKG